MTIGVHGAGEGPRVFPRVTGLYGTDLGRLPSCYDAGGRRFGAGWADAARQLDRVCVGGQGVRGWIESSGSVRASIFDGRAEAL